MRENLGYKTYYAQGGDWGAGVTGWLAIDYPEVVKAIHLNLMIVAPQTSADNEAERKFWADAVEDEKKVGRLLPAAGDRTAVTCLCNGRQSGGASRLADPALLCLERQTHQILRSGLYDG